MSKLWAIPIVVVPPLAAAAFLCFIFYSPWFRRYREGMLSSRSYCFIVLYELAPVIGICSCKI
jgi:hypothetical protein